MLSAAIVGIRGAASIGTAGLLDSLKKADLAWALHAGAPDPVFQVVLVGLDGSPIACQNGVWLQPDVAAADMQIPDLVVVPSLDDQLDDSFEANRDWVPWLAEWHDGGAKVASSCTGAFLVAAAGLLNGRSATTHWMHADELQRLYPQVVVAMDRMIIDNGDVITAGGGTAFLNLVLYLMYRFGGHERAHMAAKMLIDGHRPMQLPYVGFWPERAHDDQVIHAVQQYIDDHLHEHISIADLSTRFGMSARTLSRRFLSATGRNPTGYLQHVRVGQAKRMLETTADSVDRIRRRAGYRDPAAFRRAFKESVGLTPTQYRAIYGRRNIIESG